MARSSKAMRSRLRPLLEPLLLLIRTKEANGYDDVVAHLRKHKPANLLNMRLSEVRAWQKFHDPSTRLAEAVGAYQFTKETIDSIVRLSDIRWDDRFGPVLQDHMALDLLIRRTNVVAYLQGKASEDDLLTGIARIWASFPVPKRMRGSKVVVNAGGSFYAGVGNNKAYVKVSDVRNAVRQSRQYASKMDSGATVASLEAKTKPTKKVDVSEAKRSAAISDGRKAVITYQRWLNSVRAHPTLKVDGLLGRNTISAAKSIYHDHIEDVNIILKGRMPFAPKTGTITVVRKWLQVLRSPRRVVEAYQTILNMKRSASEQILVDGLYGPATHAAAQQQGRPILADLKNLSVGNNI